MLPPRLGSLADSFLTPRRRPQPHIDPGAPACMAWPGPGQGPPGDTGTAGGGAGGTRPRPVEGPGSQAQGRRRRQLTIYGRSHTLPSFSPFC